MSIGVLFNTSWWLNQPNWKICSSNWIISPRIEVKLKHIWNHHLENIPVRTWLKNQQNLNSLVKSITSPSEVPTWRIILKKSVGVLLNITYPSFSPQPTHLAAPFTEPLTAPPQLPNWKLRAVQCVQQKSRHSTPVERFAHVSQSYRIHVWYILLLWSLQMHYQLSLLLSSSLFIIIIITIIIIMVSSSPITCEISLPNLLRTYLPTFGWCLW